MKMILLTKIDGTKFTIPVDSVAACDDQSRTLPPTQTPCYYLRQTNGVNWRIVESPDEVFRMIAGLQPEA